MKYSKIMICQKKQKQKQKQMNKKILNSRKQTKNKKVMKYSKIFTEKNEKINEIEENNETIDAKTEINE